MSPVKEAPSALASIANLSGESLNTHGPTVERPWGSFTTLEEGRGYKIKRIEVNSGHRLSLQMHHHRSEHWIVVSGTAKVICCLLYTSPSPRDGLLSRMPSSA